MVTVKVSDLKRMIQELEREDIEYVDVRIIEKQEFEEEVIPAYLNFDAYDGYGGGINFGDIENVEVNPSYKMR